jgi:hypothetical protein
MVVSWGGYLPGKRNKSSSRTSSVKGHRGVYVLSVDDGDSASARSTERLDALFVCVCVYVCVYALALGDGDLPPK